MVTAVNVDRSSEIRGRERSTATTCARECFRAFSYISRDFQEKIVYNYAVDVSLNKYAATRGDEYKINNYTFHYNSRKYYFFPRVVNVWNILPDNVIDAENT